MCETADIGDAWGPAGRLKSSACWETHIGRCSLCSLGHQVGEDKDAESGSKCSPRTQESGVTVPPVRTQVSARGVAPLVECLLIVMKIRGRSPAPHKLGRVVCKPVIPELGRWRQEDPKFKVPLSDMTPHLINNNNPLFSPGPRDSSQADPAEICSESQE